MRRTPLERFDDAAIELARELLAPTLDSFGWFSQLVADLARLKVPTITGTQAVVKSARLLTLAMVEVSPIITAHLALQVQKNPDFEKRASSIVEDLALCIKKLEQIKTIVESDPTALDRINKAQNSQK